ncbi:GNAT family N-acetyltransferase [Undibacterium sp. RTI2.1]|nr:MULTISPECIES: GNAT family N-acetyltransferase [unclassified Undibacterium]MEB0031416.1 GNAT family N-acetyltransferase [Undibacterium sp. RTI2.1]MEB0232779.1 GNAT family N-acetyltransferase [Undibacterium sp. 10I3]MEB0259531.1 GNAT family N-acetyltransferase [Undibacterium sp. 5I1]
MSRTSFTIRAAEPADAVRLTALGIHVWLHTYAKNGISDPIARYILEEFTVTKMRALIADSKQRVLVAENNENLLGYATLNMGHLLYDLKDQSMADLTDKAANQRRAKLETLYVQEHFTGQGIGQALLQRALQEITDKFDTLWLMANAQNQRAIDFYLAMGFIEEGITYFDLEGSQHKNLVLAYTLNI